MCFDAGKQKKDPIRSERRRETHRHAGIQGQDSSPPFFPRLVLSLFTLQYKPGLCWQILLLKLTSSHEMKGKSDWPLIGLAVDN